MHSTFGIREPSSVEATMSITMTTGEWEKISDQLRAAHPGWALSHHINRLVDRAKKQFYESGSDGE